MIRTINIIEIQNSGVDSWSVKDDSPRGVVTKCTTEIKPGDKVVIDNYFTTVVDAPVQEAAETAQSKASPVERIRTAVEAKPARSAWDRGVKLYAAELLEELKEAIEGGYFDAEDVESPKLLRRQLLNGAMDWDQYSCGGCSLIYDCDIAKRLCSPSELKRTKGGERQPNSRETWLDVQARALHQAANVICNAVKIYVV